MKKSCFKGCFCPKAGFTLIELLVVVLIIGILAAVAVPQYQKAVMKSRAMGIMPLVKAIDTAQQVYKLANGTYSDSFEKLDLALPEGTGTICNDAAWIVSGEIPCVSYKNSYCYLMNTSSVTCVLSNRGISIEKYYSWGNTSICWANDTNDTLAQAVCKGLAGGADPIYNGRGYLFR